MKKGAKKMIELLIIVLVCVTMGGFGQIYMKIGLNRLGGIRLNEILTPKIFNTIFETHIFIGLMLYACATLLWFVALSKGEVSLVYPLISIGYIFTAFLSKLYFNENITMLRWFGILLIVGGVFLVAKG